MFSIPGHWPELIDSSIVRCSAMFFLHKSLSFTYRQPLVVVEAVTTAVNQNYPRVTGVTGPVLPLTVTVLSVIDLSRTQ